MSEGPLIAIQINGTSFRDEGVEPVLDVLQERAHVNGLFLGTPAWTRGIGGRQVPGHHLPDHGAQEYDYDYVGGDYARTRPEYFGGTFLGPVPRATEFGDGDLLEQVVPAALARGIAPYALLDESSYIQAVRDIPNMPKVLEVDVWGRPSTRMCFNNPDYRNWWLSVVEDYVKNYGLQGIAMISERGGPLNTAVQGAVYPEGLTCFCTHCRSIALERGIDPDRARRGYREVLRWNQRLQAGERPSDGAFTTFWRILLEFPEVLAWQTLWTDGQHQLYRDVYGVAKASNPLVQVGWHMYHTISWSPFYRADQDYAKLAEFSDFLKIVAYDNAGGPRLHSFVRSISNAFFADLTPEEAYPVLLRLLDLDEGDLASLPQTGLSPDYVRRETARAVRSAGATKIYTGIDIDIPVGTTPEADADRVKRFEGNMGQNRNAALQAVNNDTTRGEKLTSSSPEGVRDAVLAAFEGGASGIVLSRKYSEMMLDNLSGVGAALDRLGF
jgi:hypothetical protein